MEENDTSKNPTRHLMERKLNPVARSWASVKRDLALYIIIIMVHPSQEWNGRRERERKSMVGTIIWFEFQLDGVLSRRS